jgi:hypothetical protein
MSRKKDGRRRSRSRIWYVLGVTYCWSYFLNLGIYVIRIGYIETRPTDPYVSIWQVPTVPVVLSLVVALFYSILNILWLPLALGLASILAGIGQAIRHPRRSLQLITQASRGTVITRCLIWQACFFLPRAHRARYEAEWLAELDYLRSLGTSYLRWAVGILCSAPWTGLVLRGQLLLVSPSWKRLSKLGPLWVGVLTAIAVFSSIAASWFPRDGQLPSRKQVVCATIAALLSGGLSGIHSWREQHRKEERTPKRDRH